MNVFNLIKNNDFEKIYILIKNKEIKNFDIKDENYNYFIQYIIIYNQIKILNLIIELAKSKIANFRLDIFDIDGRSLLYNCVKFNYFDICKLLIEYNKSTIGISIVDIKDKLGYTALHYSIILNNFEIFKLLLDNDTDPYIIAKDGNNAYILCLMYNRINILNYLLKNKKFIDFKTLNNESILQVALNYQNTEIINTLFDFNINLNNVSNDFGLALIHQSIILDNFKVFNILLDKDININLSDFYGNTPLHYIIIDNRFNYLELLLEKKNINFNLADINGNIPLHILLDKSIDFKNNINIKKIIIESNLNIQNNLGITCLMKLVSNNLLDLFYDILIIKPLNFYIEDNNFKHIKITDSILDLLVNSYYNQIKIDKDELLLDWEKWCSIDLFEKLKKIVDNEKGIIGKTSEEICKNKIKYVIKKEKRTLPAKSNINF